MKKIPFITAALVCSIFVSCNNNKSSVQDSAVEDTATVQDLSTVQNDSAVLSDDSATVKTAVGVKDEEKMQCNKKK